MTKIEIGGEKMSNQNKIYYDVNDITEMLGVSKGFGYKIIRQMNSDLKSNGFLVIAGRVPVKYFQEKYYGFNA